MGQTLDPLISHLLVSGAEDGTRLKTAERESLKITTGNISEFDRSPGKFASTVFKKRISDQTLEGAPPALVYACHSLRTTRVDETR